MAIDPTDGRIVSWKQIAQYLQCEERTAQRWEQQRGLPIRRMPGDKRGTVFAFTDELDTWLRNPPPDQSNSATQPVTTTTSEPPASDGRSTSRIFQRHMGLMVSMLFMIVVSATVWIATLSRSRFAQEVEDRVPSRYEFLEKELIVQNRSGKALWVHRFEGPLRMENQGNDAWSRVHFQDLDNDGNVEVIVAMGHTDDFAPGTNPQEDLYCFRSDGSINWKYRFSEPLRFGATTYSPPFIARSVLVTGDDHKHVWVAYVHKLWWPSVLLKLDERGREVGRFVNAGYIYSLANVRNTKGTFILAGGVNNEHNAGMLAIIDAENPHGSSPQTLGSLFECIGCGNGRPQHYFMFPRSELNRVTASPYNGVYTIRLLQDRIDAITLETQASPGQRSESHYEFDLDFKLIGARRGDAYWNVHRAQELQRAVRHAAPSCPEYDRPLTIRRWQHGSWLDIRPLDTLSTSK